MTCEAVREQLLTADTPDFEALQPHLSHCAGCASLASAIRRTEAELRQHVEDFVNAPTAATLDAQWAAALDRAGPSPRTRPWSLHALLLALAAAAVLAVAVMPVLGPDGPEPEPPAPTTLAGASAIPEALQEGRARLAEFEQIDVTRLDATGLDQKAEDALLRDTLSRKAQALVAVERELTKVMDSGEPTWRVEALRDLGDAYASMGRALLDMPYPSYLSEAQHDIYALTLWDKAKVQLEKAIHTWKLGRALAKKHGLDTSASELDARMTAMRRSMALETARLETPQGRNDRLEAALERLTEQLAQIRAALATHERCLAPSALAELRAVLDQADQTVRLRDLDMAPDVETLLQTYAQGLAQAVEDCEAR